MLTVETKFQSGGKLLPHSDLRGGVFLGEALRRIRRDIMDLQDVGGGYVDWIGVAQDRDGWRKLVNAVMNLQVP